MNLLPLFSDTDRENRAAILGLIEFDPDAKILDLGCGNGSFALQLADCAGTKDVWGVDFLEDLCKSAREFDINTLCSDLNECLPFGDETFDVIHANQVIEHLAGTDTFVREIYRVLVPGGYAIISTPNLSGLHNIVSLILGMQPFSAHASNEIILGNTLDPKHGLPHEYSGAYHLRTFSPMGLKELFEYHGFEVEQLLAVGFYPFSGRMATLLNKVDRTHSVYITMKARKSREKKGNVLDK
jgi:ubiquinone/menaquinone biosynthesis C-methylase UbiE